MSLSCSCDYEWDGDYGEWCYWFPYGHETDFEPLKTSRRKRCVSCGDLIDIGSMCIRFQRFRNPYDDIEAKIVNFDWNSEPPIQIADHYHCEKCGEIYLNLTDIGYCVHPKENMADELKNYQKMTGFKPINQSA